MKLVDFVLEVLIGRELNMKGNGIPNFTIDEMLYGG